MFPLTETLENVRTEIKKGRYKEDELASTIIRLVSINNEINRKRKIQ